MFVELRSVKNKPH